MSSAFETVRIIRVFVSSPGDVAAERAVMDELVESINRTDGKTHRVRLELFRWEDDVVPQIGPKSQQVVDSQTPAYDIYLGIMSTRFGTPTDRYGSGAEKEFKDALKQWKAAGAPWLTSYFDDLAVNPLLLTAMCIIYDEGKRLPYDKYTLYDRIIDTVLHKRYAGRESIDVIRGRLAAVALGMHTGEALGQTREAPEALASAKEIDRVFESYQKLDGSTDAGLRDIASVREDLLSQSGLLVDRGDRSM